MKKRKLALATLLIVLAATPEASAGGLAYNTGAAITADLTDGINVYNNNIDIGTIEASITDTDDSSNVFAIAAWYSYSISLGNIASTSDITATTSSASAYTLYGNGIAINGDLSGDIAASSDSQYAFGIYSAGEVTISGDLSGSITANAEGGSARGIRAGGDVTITNISGTIAASGGSEAYAINQGSEGHALDIGYADGVWYDGITGAVSATVNGSAASGDDGFAIAGYAVSDHIKVSQEGVIIGDVLMDAGDDVMKVCDTADITGIPVLDGGADNDGADTDTLTFEGWSGKLSESVINWEEIEVSDASTVDLPGVDDISTMSASNPYALSFTNLTIDATSTLLADGDSPGFYTLTGDITNSGTLTLVDTGSEPDALDRLEIDGNYEGDNGIIALDVNTETGESDQVTITGDATGTTTIDLNELGTPTTPAAPPTLVTVNGTVAADAFTAGEYSYGAKVGTYTLGYDATTSTFTLDAFSIGYSDEAALMQGVTSFVERLGFESLTGFRERHAYGDLQCGAEAEPASLWVRGFGSSFRLGQEGNEVATSMSGYSTGTQFGADLVAGSVNEAGQYSAGLFAGTAYQKVEVTGIEEEKAGEISQQVYTMGLYGSIGKPGCYWVESVMQAGYHDLDITSREEPGTLNEELWSVAASLEAGVRVPVSEAFSLEPSAQVIWQHQGAMDLGTEMGAIAISEHNGLRTRVGATGTVTTASLPFSPFFEANLQWDSSAKAKVAYAESDEVLQSEAERAHLGGALGIASASTAADALDYFVKVGALYGVDGEGSYDYTLTAGLRKSF